MQQSNLKNVFATAFTFTLLVLFTFNAKAGADSYEIYLNNKLILKQYVTEPLNIKSLQLDKANSNDKLIIFYSHCGKTGNSRSIAIKDEKGNIIKQWKFADATSSGKGMAIPVRELLLLEKNNTKAHLQLYYAAQQLPKGCMLTSLELGKKDLSHNDSKINFGYVWTDIYYLAYFKI